MLVDDDVEQQVSEALINLKYLQHIFKEVQEIKGILLDIHDEISLNAGVTLEELEESE